MDKEIDRAQEIFEKHNNFLAKQVHELESQLDMGKEIRHLHELTQQMNYIVE